MLYEVITLRVLNKTDLVDQHFVVKKCREYQAVSLSALNAETFGPFFEAAGKIIGSLGSLEHCEDHLTDK